LAVPEKKQIPLRLSSDLHKELAAWAEDEFRSVNGQIEYLLTECVHKRKGKSASTQNKPAGRDDTPKQDDTAE
jgi:hypothetical protein